MLKKIIYLYEVSTFKKKKTATKTKLILLKITFFLY